MIRHTALKMITLWRPLGREVLLICGRYGGLVWVGSFGRLPCDIDCNEPLVRLPPLGLGFNSLLGASDQEVRLTTSSPERSFSCGKRVRRQGAAFIFFVPLVQELFVLSHPSRKSDLTHGLNITTILLPSIIDGATALANAVDHSSTAPVTLPKPPKSSTHSTAPAPKTSPHSHPHSGPSSSSS